MVYVFLAEGFEEIEAITVIDVLRRADIEVKSVGVDGEEVRGTHGIYVKADCALNDNLSDNIKGVILPGGMPGTKNLLNNSKVCDIVKRAYSSGALVGAICAAPSILGRLDILHDKETCCYPGFESEMRGARVQDKSVCADGNIITSRGPGTAIEFALKIVEYLCGESVKRKVREEMLANFQ